MSEAIDKFKTYFSDLGRRDVDLGEIYADTVEFKDPIHEITGLSNLRAYFEKLNRNLEAGSFAFVNEKRAGDQWFLEWEMILRLKRPAKVVKAQGISVLTVADRIVFQRDYFDAGELFYENIPMLGKVIRAIKRRIAG